MHPELPAAGSDARRPAGWVASSLTACGLGSGCFLPGADAHGTVSSAHGGSVVCPLLAPPTSGFEQVLRLPGSPSAGKQWVLHRPVL